MTPATAEQKSMATRPRPVLEIGWLRMAAPVEVELPFPVLVEVPVASLSVSLVVVADAVAVELSFP